MSKPFFDTIGGGFFDGGGGEGSGGGGGGGSNANLAYVCQIATIIKKTDKTPVEKINELKQVKEDIEAANPNITLPSCTCNQTTSTGFGCSQTTTTINCNCG
jgi:hypothetical protein